MIQVYSFEVAPLHSKSNSPLSDDYKLPDWSDELSAEVGLLYDEGTDDADRIYKIFGTEAYKHGYYIYVPYNLDALRHGLDIEHSDALRFLVASYDYIRPGIIKLKKEKTE